MKHKLTLISIAMATLVLVSLCAVGASAAQGSSANVQAPPLVGASIQGAPAVCSQDGVGLDLFVRGTDLHLYWLHSADGLTWTPSTAVDLGGICTSNPAATSPAAGYIDVFVRGTTGELWEKNTSNAGAGAAAIWTWKLIGGLLLDNTGPAAYSFGGVNGQVGWFVTGTTHALWQQWSINGATSGWQNLGGYLTSAPAATAPSDGSVIGVVVGGTNGNVWYRQGTANGWGSWTPTQGQLLSSTSPAAYNWGTGSIGWFVTGTNSQLYQQTYTGSTSGWTNLDGILTSSPGATAKSIGTIDVFGRGSGGGMATLYQRSFNTVKSGQWSDWMIVGQVGP
jgi:hypothetical protein